ncbi:hypothetical protein TDB9533_01558 [Thalassocella blandensis]|nr:hypothetical protein TDB9533_01558 [Thalassocella blandensis]
MHNKKLCLSTVVACLVWGGCASAHADAFSEAVAGGKASADIRVRFESVEQENNLDDASALTERTRIAYTTGSINGFSAMVEFEDVRIVGGVDEYTVGPSGFNPGEYSVIADPETTELDQAFIAYKSEGFSAKLGRQVMTFDNHRFVGHVGWRQDRQTFDGAAFSFTHDLMTLSYNFIGQRNRIFAEDADVNANDHLLNAAFKIGPGTLTAYAYLLEIDDDSQNALDTFGLRYAASVDKLSFAAEFATQSQEAEVGPATVDVDSDYMMAELGYDFGVVNVKAHYESLGAGQVEWNGLALGNVGFATPLATLHKFNGWADIFLNTPEDGLEDMSASIGGKVAGGVWSVTYHDFSAEDGGASYGSELDAVYSRNFGKYYNAGIKYADYSADDFAVDTTKLWVWVGAKF